MNTTNLVSKLYNATIYFKLIIKADSTSQNSLKSIIKLASSKPHETSQCQKNIAVCAFVIL